MGSALRQNKQKLEKMGKVQTHHDGESPYNLSESRRTYPIPNQSPGHAEAYRVSHN